MNRISSAAKRSSETSPVEETPKRVKRESDANMADVPRAVLVSRGAASADEEGEAPEQDAVAYSVTDGTVTDATINAPRAVHGLTQTRPLNDTRSYHLLASDADHHDRPHTDHSNSRSRTSSIPLHPPTSSSEGINSSHSPPTSPLTDLAPSSPHHHHPHPHNTALASPVADEPSDVHTPRAPKRIPDADVLLSTPRVHGTPRKSTPRRGSVAEHEHRSPSAAAATPKSQRDMEEEESVKLAKMLVAEDAGLRRRGGVGVGRYTR